MLKINYALFYSVMITLWILYRIIRTRKIGKINIPREVLVNICFSYACAVIWITFFSMNISAHSFDPSFNIVPIIKTVEMIQYASLSTSILNIVGNFVLLLPVGLFAPLLNKKLRKIGKVTCLGLFLCLGIELTQLLLRVRIFDSDDIIINTLGIAVGYIFYLIICQTSWVKNLLSQIDIENATGKSKRWECRSLWIYISTVAVLFVSIYSVQIYSATQTLENIEKSLAVQNSQLRETMDLGEFKMFHYDLNNGEKHITIYRNIFLHRYMVFVDFSNTLEITEGTYDLMRMSTSSYMNNFIIVKSEKEITKMLLQGKEYTVSAIDGYFLVYMREPSQDRTSLDSMQFIDGNGHEVILMPNVLK